jgi:hypothetical protein
MKQRLSIGIAMAFLLAAGNAEAAGPQRPEPQRSVVVRVSDSGFHWGDAGIGAAGATGALLLIRGLATATRGKEEL